jgi:hypothetical protein
MARRSHTPEQIVRKLREADRVNRPGFPGGSIGWFSGRGGLSELRVVGVFDLCWGEIVEFTVAAFVVEPADPAARGDLESSSPRQRPPLRAGAAGFRFRRVDVGAAGVGRLS